MTTDTQTDLTPEQIEAAAKLAASQAASDAQAATARAAAANDAAAKATQAAHPPTLTPEQLDMAAKIFAARDAAKARDAQADAEDDAAEREHEIVNHPLLGRIKETVKDKPLAALLPIREEISKYVSHLSAIAHLAGFSEADRLARHKAELAFLDHLLK